MDDDSKDASPSGDTSYDAYAELYDAAMDAAGPAADVAFYRDLATAAGGPTLEVGCGTGRVYLPLLRAGVDADGIDVSTGMLDRLRTKAAAEGLDPDVWTADVREFDPPREYDLATVPFRAINHLTDLADRRRALRRIRDALAPGGRLALNSFVPSYAYVCEQYGEPEDVVVSRGGDEYRLRTVPTVVDDVADVARLDKRAHRLDDDGTPVEEIYDRSTQIALIPPREFELLFEATGFSSWEVYGGFDRDALTDPTQDQVWIVEN